MHIHARLSNSVTEHRVVTSLSGADRDLPIPAREDGRGSSVTGGELLCAAVASCFCNDLFRESRTFDVEIIDVQVHVRSVFGSAGQPMTSMSYDVEVTATGERAMIENLVRHTDSVAEIHNTLRLGMPILLDRVEVRSISYGIA